MARSFEKDLENLINYYAKEKDSNTPDFILAQYLLACLEAFATAVNSREDWYGREEEEATEPVLEGSDSSG